MDGSIRRIETDQVRISPSLRRRRRDGSEPEFELDLEAPVRPEEREGGSDKAREEGPVAPRGEDEAGARLDVTA